MPRPPGGAAAAPARRDCGSARGRAIQRGVHVLDSLKTSLHPKRSNDRALFSTVASSREDNFSKLLARLEVLEGSRTVRERKDAVHGRMQSILVHVVQHRAELAVIAHRGGDQREMAEPHPRQQ